MPDANETMKSPPQTSAGTSMLSGRQPNRVPPSCCSWPWTESMLALSEIDPLSSPSAKSSLKRKQRIAGASIMAPDRQSTSVRAGQRLQLFPSTKYMPRLKAGPTAEENTYTDCLIVYSFVLFPRGMESANRDSMGGLFIPMNTPITPTARHSALYPSFVSCR
eukprot:scaffold435_cov342-Pavlova_lutheri.AAC.1